MKCGKLISILIVVCVAITFLGVVSAAEITIADEKFNIPDGFKENPGGNNPGSSSNGITTYKKEFENSNGDLFIIQVDILDDGEFMLTPNNGDVNKKINGIDGLYNDQLKVFTYVDDGKLITISVSDEGLLKDILVKP
jgi:hypothetical protein